MNNVDPAPVQRGLHEEARTEEREIAGFERVRGTRAVERRRQREPGTRSPPELAGIAVRVQERARLSRPSAGERFRGFAEIGFPPASGGGEHGPGRERDGQRPKKDARDKKTPPGRADALRLAGGAHESSVPVAAGARRAGLRANVRAVRARVLLVLGGLTIVACGGRSPTVTSLPSPVPSATPPASVHPVAGVVFYDENGNGVPDPGEDARLPHVLVTLGGRSAESDAEGAFLVSDVPAGTRAVTLGAASLPPFYRPGRLPSVAVPLPDGARVPVPVVLPIGANRPNVYLAFGDSITSGDGSRGNRGYRASLESQLRDYWGRADIVNDGLERIGMGRRFNGAGVDKAQIAHPAAVVRESLVDERSARDRARVLPDVVGRYPRGWIFLDLVPHRHGHHVRCHGGQTWILLLLLLRRWLIGHNILEVRHLQSDSS